MLLWWRLRLGVLLNCDRCSRRLTWMRIICTYSLSPLLRLGMRSHRIAQVQIYFDLSRSNIAKYRDGNKSFIYRSAKFNWTLIVYITKQYLNRLPNRIIANNCYFNNYSNLNFIMKLSNNPIICKDNIKVEHFPN